MTAIHQFSGIDEVAPCMTAVPLITLLACWAAAMCHDYFLQTLIFYLIVMFLAVVSEY